MKFQVVFLFVFLASCSPSPNSNSTNRNATSDRDLHAASCHTGDRRAKFGHQMVQSLPLSRCAMATQKFT